MRSVLLVLAAVLLAAPQVRAQGVAFAVTRTENWAGGGWGMGETFQGTALRVEVPRRTVVTFVSVARTQVNNSRCGQCGTDNVPTVFLVGTSIRAYSDAARRFVPYAGLGLQLTAWDNGDRLADPHVHAGVDLFVAPLVALRAEGQSHGSLPGNVSVGLRVRVP